MTEIAYDPELPYAFLNTSDELVARFSEPWLAERFEKEIAVGKVVDTTPKPKIPEGAEFIYWDTRSGKMVAVRENYNPFKPWEWEGHYFSEEDLLKEIGDAEVTVLVRKDAS